MDLRRFGVRRIVANDIIGGPELLVVKARLFWLFPCSVMQLNCIEAWVRWTGNNRDEVLQTVAGAAQLLHFSCRTGETALSFAQFLDGDVEAAIEVYLFWCELNYGKSDLPKIESKSKAIPTESPDVMITKTLAARYRYSLETINSLTPVQQIHLLHGDVEAPSNTFATDDDYLKAKNV